MTGRKPTPEDEAAAEKLLGGRFPTTVPYEGEVDAYCVQCRAKRRMHMPQRITMHNGKPAITGSCITCGAHMARIGQPERPPDDPEVG